MNLNSTNIPYILKRLSCCITGFSSLLYKQSQIGNKDCFKETVDNILILNNIYKILDKSVTITYPTYQFNISTFPNPTVCVCNIIDNNTGIILAQGYNTTTTSSETTSQYAIELALNNLTTNYSCYVSTIMYTGMISRESIPSAAIYSIINNCTCNSNLSIHLYEPIVDTPPYGGIFPNEIGIDLLTTNISQTFIPGNCSYKQCFTQDELNQLYQESLNICKDCNCN